MAEFLFCSIKDKINLNNVENFLNPTNNFKVYSKEIENIFSAISFLENSPLKGARYFENEKWLILFPGDLIGYDEVPFQKFIDIIENNHLEQFEEFDGYFSILAYNKKSSAVFLIGDRLSNYPIYYFINDKEIILTSSIPVLVNLIQERNFNKKWLYNYLFFNYPLEEVSLLNDVYRVPASSYLKLNLNSGDKEVKNYAEYFTEKENLAKGEESFRIAKEIFKERIPKYFSGSNKIACALTGGWDGRTNLALAPNREKVTAYTYGSPECRDLVESNKITSKLNIKSKQLFFDDNFFKLFPNILFETVFISAGLQGVLRASLLYSYEILASSGFNLSISGLNYDVLFRGHFGIPAHISPHFGPILKNGVVKIDMNYWKNILNNSNDFYEETESKLDQLKIKLRDFTSPAAHLTYNNYYAMPRYFGGEMKVASNFLTIRVPGFDSEILKLAYSIKEACLSYSQLAGHKRNKRDEMVIQAYIFKELGGEFYNLPIRNTKPEIVLSGEIPFFIYTYYTRIRDRIYKLLTPNKRAYLEDWDNWLNIKHKKFVDDLVFNNEALINEYFTKNFLQELKEKREIQILGKVITTEIILRLIKNKWKRFW